MLCLLGSRFNMSADILRQGYYVDDDFHDIEEDGEWVNQQDLDSGEIIRIWTPKDKSDDPDTPVNEGLERISCEARGIVDGGIRVAGTTERFSRDYNNIDFVKMTFPASEKISKRDRITNIRDSSGNIIWKEEEIPSAPPTVFNVNGVTPILDPFGNHIESFALLERAEKQ